MCTRDNTALPADTRHIAPRRGFISATRFVFIFLIYLFSWLCVEFIFSESIEKEKISLKDVVEISGHYVCILFFFLLSSVGVPLVLVGKKAPKE